MMIIAKIATGATLCFGAASVASPSPAKVVECPGCQVTESIDDNHGALMLHTNLVMIAGTCKLGPQGEGGQETTGPDCVPNVDCKISGTATVTNHANFSVFLNPLCGGGMVTIPAQGFAGFSICTVNHQQKIKCGTPGLITIFKTSDGTKFGEFRWDCAACPTMTGN